MKKNSFILVIFIFLLLYFPPIININTLHIVGAFSWIGIIYYNKSILKTLKIQKILYLYLILILLTIYLILIALVNESSFNILSKTLFWCIDIIPASILVSHICHLKGYKVNDLVKLLLIAGNLQGFLSLIAFISPSFQAYIIERMVSLGYRDIFMQLAQHRMYGLSSSLTFSTPIVQGMFSVFAIYLAINKNIKYIFFAPLLVFSAIINARSSIVIVTLGILIILIYSVKINYIRRSFRIIIITVLTIISTMIISEVIKSNSPKTYEWIIEGSKEIILFLQGDSTGYFSYITNTAKYILPSGIGLWFGKGVNNINEYSYSLQSDVGWTNDIWLGGILYSITIYRFFAKMLHSIYRYKSDNFIFNRFFASFFLLSLIVANFKGIIIGNNEIVTLIFLIYIFIVCKNHHVNH